MAEIDNYQDIIDVRDIIEAFEAIEDDPDERDYADALASLLNELRGNGGDEQWRGDWYPITLIRDSYFTTYAQELAEDIGAISSDSSWPNSCIDWQWAARELRMDYTSVEYGSATYWYR